MLGVLALVSSLLFTGCNNDDEPVVEEPGLTGNKEEYTLFTIGNSGVTGKVTFTERDDNTTLVTIVLTGVATGADHPVHIHANTAVETGGIIISLTNVDAAGKSETAVTALDDGTAITYSEMIAFDGYVNVHNSSGDLGTLVVQGDIGQNELTGMIEDFDLFEAMVDGISGDITFAERVNGETLVTIDLEGTTMGGDHPAHIHTESVAEGGGIVISLNNVDGATGISKTNIAQNDEGSIITYSDLKEFDGHAKVHMSGSNLGTIIAEGDIGINKLTSNSVAFPLMELGDSGISGSVTFTERESGASLVTIDLSGTASDGNYPAHIHANTAAEGGGIMISLNNVNGNGDSDTHIEMDNDGTAVTYDELVDYNGYVNIHQSPDNLGTLVSQGDIGQNALTGESVEYPLNSVSNPTVSGTATFEERINGTTLVTIALDGTIDGNEHPAHIHMNTAAEGGGIVIGLNTVNGATGISKTSVKVKDDMTAITYDDMVEFNGYINVHNSASDLGTLVAQGDIGQNALTGESVQYTLNSATDPAISGTATFAERSNGTTLVTIALVGTTNGNEHPAHIHMNSATEGGGIVISLNVVDGGTGISKTSVKELDDMTEISYDEMINFDGYINVHNSESDLGTLIAQGDIGSNG